MKQRLVRGDVERLARMIDDQMHLHRETPSSFRSVLLRISRAGTRRPEVVQSHFGSIIPHNQSRRVRIANMFDIWVFF
jgi:hypothetical protein